LLLGRRTERRREQHYLNRRNLDGVITVNGDVVAIGRYWPGANLPYRTGLLLEFVSIEVSLFFCLAKIINK
jgi:hypothetical protein